LQAFALCNSSDIHNFCFKNFGGFLEENTQPVSPMASQGGQDSNVLIKRRFEELT
jgi:hypothetical protein